METNEVKKINSVSKIGLIGGPLAAALILLIGAPASMEINPGTLPDAWIALALLVLMASWWVTEAVPIPVTSLLPLLVLPLTGISTMAQVSAPYMHPIVVLLMGGFIFAKAIERWGLHERIALNVLSRSGGNPAGLVAGFMLAAAVLSMWISNSATSIMMMPIALSVAASVKITDGKHNQDFTYALLLGIAYACSIGGLGTPIGTPTNLIVLGYLNDQGGSNIGFTEWMMIGVPTISILLPLTWLALTRWAFTMPKLDIDEAREQISTRLSILGRISKPEFRTLIIFLVVASLWVFKRPINSLEISFAGDSFTPFSGLTDPMTAIIAVLLCFIIPAGNKEKENSQKILDWQMAETIPWGVLLLFGGGMSLAQAISSTGLSAFIGESLSFLEFYPTLLLIFAITVVVLALTEVTSNVATASALMPVFGAISIETGLPLEVMAAPIALAASCAFMLPMATGPNAVAFSTNKVSLVTMAKAGLRINIIAVLVITLVAYFIAPLALG